MEVRYFSKIIVEWYEMNKRSLPWRSTKDPYKVWLSEIILQQTRVSQGLPYYKKFITEFPTVNSLAVAPVQNVLRLWQGLGYYTRARNLHTCAKEIVKNFEGKFPKTSEELKQLPGIGDYTAAAIASISYNEPVAVVDGNVFRVLSRVFGIDTPINSTHGRNQFIALANSLISKSQPAIHNQAIMEFGALYCTPKNPPCDACVFQSKCVAKKHNLQSLLPIKIPKKKIRRRYFYYFVIRHNDSVMMNHRKESDIWKGLYDFFLVEKNRASKPEKLMTADLFLKKLKPITSDIKYSKMYKHMLSHQTIISRFTLITLSKKPLLVSKTLKFYSSNKISQLPKPVLISRFLGDFQLL